MATLRARQFFELTGITNTPDQDFGDKSQFHDTTVAGRFHCTSALVADNFQVEILWLTGQGGIVAPSHCLIFSNQEVLIEIADSAGANPIVIQAKANVVQSFGGTYVNAALSADGTSQATPRTVGRISAKRNVADNVGDAVVTILLVN